MAVFNGARYLEEQLQTILGQLGPDDEVIIVDDCSRDGSIELIRNMKDRRMIVLENQSNVGPTASFERAICMAKGNYILLSDQDDIWKANKVNAICEIFESTNSVLVVSDASVIDANRNLLFESLYSLRGSRPGFWRNLYRNGFVGCCMAIRCDIKSFVLPFPPNVGMHDEWIGLCASLAGQVSFIGDKLIEYRRHGANASQLKHGSVTSMVRKRLNLLFVVLRRLPSILAWRSAAHGQLRN